MGRGWTSSDGSLALSRVRAPLAVALLYVVLAAGMIAFASGEGGVSSLWPANAVPLSLLLLRPRRDWWSILAATAVGDIIATSLVRSFGTGPILFGLVNTAEVLIAGWAIGGPVRTDRLSASSRSLARFVMAAGLAAPCCSAAMGAAVFWGLYADSFGSSFLIWYAGDALGLLFFTPFFFALFGGQYRRGWQALSGWQRCEGVALLALTAVVCITVFATPRPMLYLIIMPTMLVAFRMGWMGVKVASIIIAVTGVIATTAGSGPVAAMTPNPVVRAQFLQIFLAAQLMTQWPVVVALAARDRLTQALAKSERSLRILAAQSPVLMLDFDVDGVCRKAVGAAHLLPGRDVAAMPGLTIEQLAPRTSAMLRSAHQAALGAVHRVHSIEYRQGGGEQAPWREASFRALEDENGRCPGTIMTLHDVSVRKQEAMALIRVAETDSLTGLLNRAGFLARLDAAMATAAPGSMSLAMIDVDRFKLVNDNCGHLVGDAVLAEVGRRLAGQVRAGDLVGRMGGDEFVVLLDTGDWDQAKEMCARLVAAIAAEPVRIRTGLTINAAISCGVTQYRGGTSAVQFLNEADVALYEAKRSGRNQMVAA